jgi:hypothetical protein
MAKLYKFGNDTVVNHSVVEAAQTVVSAAPGFEQLTVQLRDTSVEPTVETVLTSIMRQPVIAWRIPCDGYFHPEPICLNTWEPHRRHISSVVLAPGGVVFEPGCNDRWDSISEWAEYVCHTWREWHEEQTKLKLVPSNT